ncbi:MAG: hypothetical protein RJA07_684 [Bacteroidota bacterium]|jgi:hypothetical protein
MQIRYKIILGLLLLLHALPLLAQQKAKVFGVVKNENGQMMDIVSVSVVGTTNGVRTGNTGFYLVEIPVGMPSTIAFSFVGFETQFITLTPQPNEEKQIDIVLKLKTHFLHDVNIRSQLERVEGMTPIEPKQIELMINASGNLEGVLRASGLASSSNELSSQYSVRGGNFDENMVYVNDFEIYRPFLIRSGQQEGLTFANPDLVSNLKFSAGGFQAKYGDKLSSVLDITYKQPKDFSGSISASLLGQAISLQGTSKNRRFSWITGFRNKTNQILLKSQPIEGEYRPVFYDYQLFTTYTFSDKFEMQAIANINQNKFRFVPQSETTSFGLVNQTVRLEVFFDGNEIDKFNTMMGGLSGIYRPRKNVKLKFMTSAFQSNEDETFDILGYYRIGEVQTDISKPNYNNIKKSLGVGTYQDYARNFLDANVVNVSHHGTVYYTNNTLSWGITAQHEYIHDRIKEWHRLDSAGYAIPYSDSLVNVYSYLKTNVTLPSYRFNGYVQNAFNFTDTSHFKLIAGARFSYWDVNKEWLISPRAQFTIIPDWKNDVVFRFGTGIYNQPPFYRELRDLDGVVHLDVKAQKSYQIVAGSDYNIKIWKRKFTFTSEAYYKYLWDVVPYEVDNVRVKYFGKNDAIAYATGIDLRLHGEFVKDADSWVSLSYLNTKENLKDDYINVTLNKNHEIIDPRIPSVGANSQDKTAVADTTLHPGWIRRPTDQRINCSIFFSDYLPKHPNYQVHLNLIFGSGLPFGPPDHNRYRDTLTIPPYRRVDVGFSAQLFDGSKEKYKHKKVHQIKSVWASLEIFNLLGVSNTVSYQWIKDIYNTTYAVPNYLTARRLNIKLTCKF